MLCSRSSFEELEAQVPEGVHAALSGIPWWTTDVGGYGCGKSQPNHSPYMQELIIRWYQFGCFSPIFRTHGCRSVECARTVHHHRKEQCVQYSCCQQQAYSIQHTACHCTRAHAHAEPAARVCVLACSLCFKDVSVIHIGGVRCGACTARCVHRARCGVLRPMGLIRHCQDRCNVSTS